MKNNNDTEYIYTQEDKEDDEFFEELKSTMIVTAKKLDKEKRVKKNLLSQVLVALDNQLKPKN